MKQCNHPNIVKLYQVIDDLRFDKILLILEYCQYGEIDWKRYNHYREKYRKIDTESTRGNTNSIPQTRLTLNKILRDIINGLEYLHDDKHIIHRDLKPSNLLINQDNTVKISDFGVSLLLENNANDAKNWQKSWVRQHFMHLNYVNLLIIGFLWLLTKIMLVTKLKLVIILTFGHWE